MTLTIAQTMMVRDLRHGADARDPERCQLALKRLLSGLTYFYALAVVLETLQAHLADFEADHPHETWVHDLLVGIASFGMAPDDSFVEPVLQQGSARPGGMNFYKAIYDLTQAMQDRHTPEARVSYMASAIVNVIMAQLVRAWYGKRPAAWERVRANVFDPITGRYSDPVATELAYTFWTHDETHNADIAAWQAVADRLERALQR